MKESQKEREWLGNTEEEKQKKEEAKNKDTWVRHSPTAAHN